jgi:NAD(P)-dependent dehydrogenase (short-subunit alcohol dehydrogenase family)
MIRNKKIWLIGAGSGIGRELALKLAASGNTVVISGRGIDSLNAVVAESESRKESDSAGDGRIVAYACDVTNDEQTAAAAVEIAAMVGALDMLVFCAGRCEYVEDAELSTDLFRRVYDVNVFGMVNAVAAVLPAMKSSSATEKPQVVGVASLSAVVGLPRAEAYGSSKAAAIYFLESLRLDLSKFNVDVTVVNPGFVETPMTASNDFPMPFLMQVDEAADCIIRGVARRKRKVNFPLRLTMTLKIAAMFPALWFGVIGPRLARREG